MPNLTFEPLRWLDEPARLTVLENGGSPRTFFQVTAYRNVQALCLGRPVEEMPRILSLLSPAHHLVSALALDDLFRVEPPPAARNIRRGLLQMLFYRGHLRKLFALLSFLSDPFPDFGRKTERGRRLGVEPHVLGGTVQALAQAREGASILGGRADHPVAATAGGVTRVLKNEHFHRLDEIARSCLDFSLRLAAFLDENIWNDEAITHLLAPGPAPLPHLTWHGDRGVLVLGNEDEQEVESIALSEAVEKIGLNRESWTRAPFAYVRSKGFPETLTVENGGLYFVGPLARLSTGEELDTPRAEQERQRMLDNPGTSPGQIPLAGFRALVVELIQASERMVDLCRRERLTEGLEIRKAPEDWGSEGMAALEAPEGTIFHHYRVDDRGLVRALTVLYAGIQNNALRCRTAEKTVLDAFGRGLSPEETKTRVELALLPW